MTIKKAIIKITIASLLSLILYLILSFVIGALMEAASHIAVNFALGIWAFLVSVVFSYILIYLIYIKDGSGEMKIHEDYPIKYTGIIKDIKLVFFQEFKILSTLCSINLASWILTGIDKLIFDRRTVTAVLFIYFPLQSFGVILPEWLNSILAYTIGSIIISMIYLLELVVIRRKWYVKSAKEEKQK